MFNIKILPQGKGLQSLFESDQESDHESTEPKNNIMSLHNSTNNKELDGTITLVVGKRENGKVDVLNAYLNGVERRVFIDSGAAVSIIHNILEPRKDRIFKVTNVQRNYLSNWHKWSETYWSSEDEEEFDDTSVNRKHENIISSDGNALYKVHGKKELTSTEDAREEKDATCSNPSIKNSSFHLSRNEDGSPVVKRSLHSTTSSGKKSDLQLEDYSRNDTQPTEEDVGIGKNQEGRKDIGNDESTKNNKVNRSKVCTCNLDRRESDEVERFVLKR